MSNPFKTVFRTVRQIGLRGTVKYGVHRVSERYYERRLSIDTSSCLTLDVHAGENIRYAPTDYASLRKVFASLDQPIERSVLLDYGAGMGRVEVFAATYPFRRIIGVELSPQLSDLARRNIERAKRRRRCADIEIVTINAVDYVVPPEVNVIYLFNPFMGETLRRVLGRIQASLAARPRALTLVCKNANNLERQLQGAGWLVKQREFPCFDDHTIAIYTAE